MARARAKATPRPATAPPPPDDPGEGGGESRIEYMTPQPAAGAGAEPGAGMANRSEALRVSGGPGKASGAGAEGEWEAETDETVLAAARRDPEEERLGIALRPTSFDEFIGQARAVNNLKIAIEAARRRGEPLRHLLFSGPPGLGKTSLAHLVAKEMGTAFHTLSAPAVNRAGDMVGILSQLQTGDVLLLDEIHALKAGIDEYIHSAMEDFRVDIAVDQGPYARTVPLPLKRFTLIGATTREGRLHGPFRDRFEIHEHLDFYDENELAEILRRSAAKLGTPVAEEAVRMMAACSRGTPRVANRLLYLVRDVAHAQGLARISTEVAREGLANHRIDQNGLNEMDRRYLAVLIDNHGGPVGVKTLSKALQEEELTLEVVREPYLIKQGYLLLTARGRQATDKAFDTYGRGASRRPGQGRGLFAGG